LLVGGAQGHLVANNRFIELKTRNLQTLAQSLEEREVEGLEFLPGTTAYEYHEILDMLSMAPVSLDGHGGVAAFLEKRWVKNVHLAATRFERHFEEEEEAPSGPTATPPPTVGGDPDLDSAALLAYLEDSTEKNAQRASYAVGSLASDAHTMAEIIFEAATAKSGDQYGGCDFDVLTDCLRKVVDVILGCPAADSSGGRLMLMGTLDDLREELLFSIQAEDEDAEFAQRTLARIIDNAKERLSIEKLFAEYAQRREMLAGRERRIIDFLRNKGFGLAPAELEMRLKQHGISDELWQELWDRSFHKKPGAGTGGDQGAVARFEEFAKHPPQRGSIRHPDFLDQLINNMADVELEMVSLVEQTRGRIEGMNETMTAALTSPTGPSRDQVMEVARALLQIGHGLAEPIKMLNTSVEIIRASNLGRLNEAQHAVLQMSAISGQRVQSLVNQLMAVAEENQT
jgi:hypothetical protein